jgi:hypothetical protein
MAFLSGILLSAAVLLFGVIVGTTVLRNSGQSAVSMVVKMSMIVGDEDLPCDSDPTLTSGSSSASELDTFYGDNANIVIFSLIYTQYSRIPCIFLNPWLEELATSRDHGPSALGNRVRIVSDSLKRTRKMFEATFTLFRPTVWSPWTFERTVSAYMWMRMAWYSDRPREDERT